MTSGKDALEWLDKCKVLPDLILLDCMMPNMSGQAAFGLLFNFTSD